MQGPNFLDLAKVISDEHYDNTNPHLPATQNRRNGGHKTRQWVGRKLPLDVVIEEAVAHVDKPPRGRLDLQTELDAVGFDLAEIRVRESGEDRGPVVLV